MLHRWIAIPVVLTTALLGGCAGVSFSNQQSEFERAQAARIQCRSATGSADVASQCASSATQLTDIARQARDAAAQAKDDRTRIGLLRLAAVSGWESATAEGLDISYAASLDGIGRCDALPANRFGSPRDCVLLAVGPAFVTHVRATEAVKELNPKFRSQPIEEDRQRLAAISGPYVANTYDVVRRVIQMRATGDARLDPAVGSYLRGEIVKFYCTADALRRLNGVARNSAGFKTMGQQIARMQQADASLRPNRCSAGTDLAPSRLHDPVQ